MALAAATLFAAPSFDLVYPDAAMAWGQPKVDVNELQQRIDKLEVLVEKLEKLEKLDTGAAQTQNGKPIKPTQQAYTPGMYNATTTIDRSKLYAELAAAIGLVFGLTFALEKSSLFPTIVRANQQYSDIKERMMEDGTWDGTPDYDLPPQADPAAKLDSMIEDAKGGLDMVQLELMKEKQERFLAEAAAKEEAMWSESESKEATEFLSTDEINAMAAEAKAFKEAEVTEEAEAVADEAVAATTAETHSVAVPHTDGPTEYETKTGVSWWTGVRA